MRPKPKSHQRPIRLFAGKPKPAPKRTSQPKPAQVPEENKPTLVAFLLDRTGSMQENKAETITGFNSYREELLKQNLSGMRFTLTQFNSISIDILHDAVPVIGVDPLTDKSYQPAGGTPLYDAIGKTIRATEKKAGDKYKVLFVTLTDGEENSSSEYSLEAIRDLIKEKEDKSAWTFAHIGVGLNGWAAARSYAHGTVSVSNILRSEPGEERAMYRRVAGQTVSYACSAGNTMKSAKNFWVGSDPADQGGPESLKRKDKK